MENGDPFIIREKLDGRRNGRPIISECMKRHQTFIKCSKLIKSSFHFKMFETFINVPKTYRKTGKGLFDFRMFETFINIPKY